jgi:hypothetical protein
LKYEDFLMCVSGEPSRETSHKSDLPRVLRVERDPIHDNIEWGLTDDGRIYGRVRFPVSINDEVSGGWAAALLEAENTPEPPPSRAALWSLMRASPF